jgi:hypothetical protein
VASPRRLLAAGILSAALLSVAACGSSATAAPGSSTAAGGGGGGALPSGLGGLGGLLPSGLLGGGGGTAAVNASTFLSADVAATIIGGTPTLQPDSMNFGPVSLAAYGTDNGDNVAVYVETLGSGLEAAAIQAAISSQDGGSGDMTPISGLGDAAGKVVGDHEATVAFGKSGTIVVVSATVDAQAGTDLEPKVEALAQQIAGQL